MMTIFRCSHCGEWLSRAGRESAELIGTGECAKCTYLHNIGVWTSDDYNKWLSGEWDIEAARRGRKGEQHEQ